MMKRGEGTEVQGGSDDYVTFQGDVYGQHDCYGHKRAMKATFSDGTVLLINYGKPNDGGLWWIRLKTAGPLFDRITEKPVEDKDGYSDIAYFKPGLTWARMGGKRVR